MPPIAFDDFADDHDSAAGEAHFGWLSHAGVPRPRAIAHTQQMAAHYRPFYLIATGGELTIGDGR